MSEYGYGGGFEARQGDLQALDAMRAQLATSEATVARLTAALDTALKARTWNAANLMLRAALVSARSQAGETDDQVPPNSPEPLPGTSAQAGRTPRTRL